MSIGISAYGCAFPSRRLPAAELRRGGGRAPAGLASLPVADVDEDALTLALEALDAVAVPDAPTLVALASTTLPYGLRVQSGLLLERLGRAGGGVLVTEHTTSARAGTEAFVLAAAALPALGGSGLVVAAEAPQSAPGTAAGGAAGAGAVALALGEDGSVATVEATSSYAAEEPGLGFTPRGALGVRDIEVAGYAEAALLSAVDGAVGPLLERLGRRAGDYDHAVVGVADERLAARAARALGVADERWRPSWPFPRLGDGAAAGPLVGLGLALDAAADGDTLLLVGYGSGSVADAVSLRAGPGAGQGLVTAALAAGGDVDYLSALRLRGAV